MTKRCNEWRWVEDDFGNAWGRCVLPDCDLQVVRPGKVQCNNACESLPLDSRWPDD